MAKITIVKKAAIPHLILYHDFQIFPYKKTLSVFGQKKVDFYLSFYFQKNQKWIGSEKLKDQ